MSIEYAMDTLTNPSPSNRQQLVKFLAERCKIRGKTNFGPRMDDVWYIIAVCQRWGAITGEEMPNFSRLAAGRLAQDVFDCWHLLVQGDI